MGKIIDPELITMPLSNYFLIKWATENRTGQRYTMSFIGCNAIVRKRMTIKDVNAPFVFINIQSLMYIINT